MLQSINQFQFELVAVLVGHGDEVRAEFFAHVYVLLYRISMGLFYPVEEKKARG
jgi:hypothetical protein